MDVSDSLAKKVHFYLPSCFTICSEREVLVDLEDDGQNRLSWDLSRLLGRTRSGVDFVILP